VFGHDGRPVAVISVCGPVERFRNETDRCAALLVPATQELSRALGYDARRTGT
jgi:DNA-binding IclR family transcriptional regulator